MIIMQPLIRITFRIITQQIALYVIHIYGWSPANFNHNLTSFPLTGKHITVDCQVCHSAGYTGTPTDCYSCHQQDYESAQDPNHVFGGYSTNCTDCHTYQWMG